MSRKIVEKSFRDVNRNRKGRVGVMHVKHLHHLHII